jgi:hypothetical protein
MWGFHMPVYLITSARWNVTRHVEKRRDFKIHLDKELTFVTVHYEIHFWWRPGTFCWVSVSLLHSILWSTCTFQLRSLPPTFPQGSIRCRWRLLILWETFLMSPFTTIFSPLLVLTCKLQKFKMRKQLQLKECEYCTGIYMTIWRRQRVFI